MPVSEAAFYVAEIPLGIPVPDEFRDAVSTGECYDAFAKGTSRQEAEDGAAFGNLTPFLRHCAWYTTVRHKSSTLPRSKTDMYPKTTFLAMRYMYFCRAPEPYADRSVVLRFSGVACW